MPGLTAAAGIDLSRPAYALLRRIDEHGPATLGDLARAPAWTRRRPDARCAGSRSSASSSARPTPPTAASSPSRSPIAGRDARRRIAEVLEAHLRDTLGRWSESDRHTLGELLTRLVDDFRDIQFRNVRSSA